MTVNSPESEKRMTPTERLHDIAAKMAERPAPVSGAPYFTVKQTKAIGGATVYEWEVHVPVCAEYPTADKAFEAQLRFAGSMRAEYGPRENGGDK